MLWVILLLKILGIVLLGLIAILVLLLVIPITYEGALSIEGDFYASYKIGWPWRTIRLVGMYDGQKQKLGIYFRNTCILKIRSPLPPEKVIETTEEVIEEAADKVQKRLRISEMLDRTLLSIMLEYIRSIINIMKPKELFLSGVYGFEDPASTGMICGAIAVIKGIFPSKNICFNPDFTREVLEIELHTAGNVRLGALMFKTIKTILKKPIRKIIFRKDKY